MSHTYYYRIMKNDFLEVEYDYQPGEPQTWEEPGCDPEVDICSVLCGGMEIIDLLSESTLEDITDKVFINITESAYESKCEAAEARRDAQREDDYFTSQGL